MAKIENDKYYTPSILVKKIIEKTISVIGLNNITDIIEPSAGNGAFIKELEKLNKSVKFFDLYPEHKKIIKKDYLKLDLEYLKGRLIIGNPPFGYRNNLSKQFLNKSLEIADYIAFILPASSYNNNQFFYKFDLIYSEYLGIINFSGVDVNVCFNIYKRPENGLNKKHNYNINNYITIQEVRNEKNNLNNLKYQEKINNFDYDFGFCIWGSVGKEIKTMKDYSNFVLIKINNLKYKTEIEQILKKAEWKKKYNINSLPSLNLWQIYKYLEEEMEKIIT